jgi:hemoglobin
VARGRSSGLACSNLLRGTGLRETIFDRYGGFATVSRIVGDFYDQALNSPILGPFFIGVDTKTLIDHQTKFVASMMGGPASFSNEHLDRVHRQLGIDDPAFEEMVLVFRDTLEDHEIEEGDIAEVLGEIQARRMFIVHA